MQAMHEYKVDYHLVNPEKPDEPVAHNRRGSVHVVAPSQAEAERVALVELKATGEMVEIDRVWPTVIRWTG